jgi:hypothetical protein
MTSHRVKEAVDFLPGSPEKASVLPACRLHLAFEREGEIRCPVCHHPVPPEHIGYKLHCRRCGYLESCCNPI